MKVGDYIIFRHEAVDKKHSLLGKVEKVNPLVVRMQPDVFGIQKTAEIPRNAVICSVGSSPVSGKVYGVDLSNIYRTSVPMGRFGRLHYFCAPDKSVRKAIRHSFGIVAKKLDAKKLDSFFDEQILFDVKHMKSAGLFVSGDSDQHIPCHICIDPYNVTLEELPHCILHEIGHYFFTKLDEEWQFKWATLYANYVKMDRYTSKEMKILKSNFIDSGLSFAEFKKQLEDVDQTYFVMVQKHLQRCFKLSPAQLQALYEENPEVVISKFPTSVQKVQYDVPVSQYATKSYHELFAESFAYHLSGTKLPNPIDALLVNTLRML